jgi:hypothetical protein
MRFGHQLQKLKIPEWSAFYIDYKSLNAVIDDTCEEALREAEQIDRELAHQRRRAKRRDVDVRTLKGEVKFVETLENEVTKAGTYGERRVKSTPKIFIKQRSSSETDWLKLLRTFTCSVRRCTTRTCCCLAQLATLQFNRRSTSSSSKHSSYKRVKNDSYCFDSAILDHIEWNLRRG